MVEEACYQYFKELLQPLYERWQFTHLESFQQSLPFYTFIYFLTYLPYNPISIITESQMVMLFPIIKGEVSVLHLICFIFQKVAYQIRKCLIAFHYCRIHIVITLNLSQ